jgi:hypothetical protein
MAAVEGSGKPGRFSDHNDWMTVLDKSTQDRVVYR